MRALLLAVLLGLAMIASAPAQMPGETPGQTPAHGRAAMLDRLFAALKSAPTTEDALAIEAQIRDVWAQQASPAVALLMGRAAHDSAGDAQQEALADYDAAVTLAPDLSEAWRLRGVTKFRLGDSNGAIADMAQALRQEPRQFMALRDLSTIAESRGDWNAALAAWQKLLEIDPQTEGAQTRLNYLRTRALGQST